MKFVRRCSTVVALAAIVSLAFHLGDLRPAEAASSTPVVSATAAGLSMDGGVVALASVGQITQAQAAVIQAATADVAAGAETPFGRMARPQPAAGSSGVSISSVCQGVGDALTGGLSGLLGGISIPGSGILASVCTGIVSGVLDLVGKVMKGFSAMIAPAVTAAFRWMFQTAIDIATGFNDKCQVKTPSGGSTLNAADKQCTGDEARGRILGVAATPTYKAILQLSLLLCFPVLLAAAISAMFKQSFSELGKALLRLPFVWIISIVAIFLVATAVGLRDGFSNYLISATDLKGNIDAFFTKLGSNEAAQLTYGVAYGFLVLVGGLIAFFGALMLFLIFMVADIVIYASVAFMPLATIGLLWGGTAKWFKRVVELMGAFVIGKVVVVAMLCLSFGILGSWSP